MPKNTQHWRAQIAQEAARIVVAEGIRDYGAAKRKAAQRLRLNLRELPGNDEVECAVVEYQRLFLGDAHVGILTDLRQTALKTMELLMDFKPKLVGPILSGTADEHSEVTLHLFADPVEAVAMRLYECRIPYSVNERALRFSPRSDDPKALRRIPVYGFLAGETPIELLVFSGRGRGQVPLSAIDGRPMRRANIQEVKALIDEAAVL